MTNLPGGADNRAQHATAWQRLADIRVPVPGLGEVSVAEMLQQISSSDADPQTRNALARECANLAAVLAPLPSAERDDVIERITDAVREAYERNEAQADNNGARQ